MVADGIRRQNTVLSYVCARVLLTSLISTCRSDADGEEFGNAVGEDHPPDGDTKGRNKCAMAGRVMLPTTLLPSRPARDWTGCHSDKLELPHVHGMGRVCEA